jgi:predicted transcriptional regulator
MNPENQELKLWIDLNPKLKASLLRGLEQSSKGIGFDHEEVMKKFRNKIKK